jgi:nanoRNase/pAp phosphatase (c-di-AMP/oligoRNAs hydrolase)
MTNKIFVLYHASCTDGLGAKYAAWKKFGDTAAYFAIQYNGPIPEMPEGSEVYIVDFSYPKAVLEEMMKVHKSVVVLDHHKSAEADLRGMSCCKFDMTKSGAVLAWEYFHPSKVIPDLLLDIQDRDLWKFKRLNSKPVHAGLQLLKGSMEAWDKLTKDPHAYFNLIETGKALLKQQDMKVDSVAKYKVKVVPFLGYNVGITNATDNASEIGNAICISKEYDVDFAIIYCVTKDDDVLCSARSDVEGKNTDVSEFAKQFGGGGHRNAAGFKISLEILTKVLKGNLPGGEIK